MMLTRRRKLVVLPAVLAGVVAVALPATAAVGAPTASASAPATQVVAPVPTLDWKPCGTGLERFLCAGALVPTDYDDPAGARTRLALTKLPAGDPARRLGTLFVNPGGPGGSGVDFVQQAALTTYPPAVRARYDILGFDPRGVARSDPATCFRTAEQEGTSPLTQDFYPLPGPQVALFEQHQVRLAVQCQTRSPLRFATASTANVARDMDLLRQAVGDPKLAYVGYSYGTYLGATYARLFPSRVGRFVLDGTVDPLAWSGTGTGDASASTPLGIRIRQGEGATETFAEFARLCRAGGPVNCPLAALGDPAVVVPRTFDRLAREPLVVTFPDGSTITIDQQYAVAATFSALYSPAQWTDLADFLAELAAPTPVPARVAVAATRVGTPSARPRGEDYPSIGGALASLCVDTTPSGRVSQYPALIAAYDRKAPYFGRYRAWAGLPCEFWSTTDEDAFDGPWQQTTTTSVLVMGTRFDPATPYRQTRPYADLFPDAHVLTLDGWGHTAIGKSACSDAAVATYLVRGVRPADGATCAPDSVPFSTPATTRLSPRPDVPPGVPAW